MTTQAEEEVRGQLAQALIARAEADEKIVQLRAMLQIIPVLTKQLEAESEADPGEEET